MPGFEVIGEEERSAILEWFDASNGVMFAHGFGNLRNDVYKVREFERSVATALGVNHAQAVSSGSAALLVGLRALGIKPGDEVITQSFTFVATVEAILDAGAVPVITEIDESYNMDPHDLDQKITERTRAIIPVHMAGSAADMESILAIAANAGVSVLEDSAQAFGGSYRGKMLGTIGNAGAFSFDFAKNITTGEGGMLVTDSDVLYQKARELHDHGHEYNTEVPRGKDTRNGPGFNFRMTEMQAAVGIAQLAKLNQILEAHRRNKALLKGRLAGLDLQYRVLHDAEGDVGDTLIFAVDSEATALKIAEALASQGLGTKNLPDAIDWHFAGTWRHMFHGIPGFEEPETLWPRSRELLRRSIALPVNVRMDEDTIDKYGSIIGKVVRSAS